MFFDIEKDVDKGALSEALSDSAEVTVVSLNLKSPTYKKHFSKTFYLNILHFSIIFIFQGQWRSGPFGFW